MAIVVAMKHPQFAARFREAVEHGVKSKGVVNTQEGLARLFKVSGVMVWSYRNGEKLPRMSTAVRIANALGVDVNWLLTGAGDMLGQSGGAGETPVREGSTPDVVALNPERVAADEDEAELLRQYRLLPKSGGARLRVKAAIADELAVVVSEKQAPAG